MCFCHLPNGHKNAGFFLWQILVQIIDDNRTQPNTFYESRYSIVVERVVAKVKDTFGCGI